ncbi:MAG: Gfo/Idh/MocA family protein [Acidimicrobiales bacterium]
MTLGVAVVGAGGMGREHAVNLCRLPGVVVRAVGDPDAGAAARLADLVGARVETDPVVAITADDVDAVVIASPDGTHPDLAVAAIESGRPALCEKPLADDLDGARRVARAEVGAGRRLVQVGFMRVFDTPHRQLAAALADLGPVVHLRAVHVNAPAPTRPVDHVLSQSIIHDVHSTRWLARSEVAAVSARVVPRPGGLRYVVVSAELVRGGLATMEFDDAGYGYEVALEVVARDGRVATAPFDRALVRRDGVSVQHVGDDWFERFRPAYRAEMEAWARAAADRTIDGPDVWDGVAAQGVVEAIARAVRSGASEVVALPERPDLYGDRPRGGA